MAGMPRMVCRWQSSAGFARCGRPDFGLHRRAGSVGARVVHQVFGDPGVGVSGLPGGGVRSQMPGLLDFDNQVGGFAFTPGEPGSARSDAQGRVDDDDQVGGQSVVGSRFVV